MDIWQQSIKAYRMNSLQKIGRIGLCSAVGIFVAVYIPLTYVAQIYSCSGPSMKPTLSEKGDYILVDKFSYKILKKKYKHGDIVVAFFRGKSMCKRVCAIENEQPLYRNARGKLVCTNIPISYVWLLGDNKNNSLDSRELGPVPISCIRGRGVLKLSFNPFHVEVFNRDTDRGKVQSTTQQLSTSQSIEKDRKKPT